MNKFKLAMALCLTAFITISSVSCSKKAETDDESSDDGGGTSKALLSSWATSNSAWAIRLDINANNSGTDFAFVVKFSDNSEVHCTGNLNGTDTSGTYTVSSCSDAGGGTYGGTNMSTVRALRHLKLAALELIQRPARASLGAKLTLAASPTNRFQS